METEDGNQRGDGDGAHGGPTHSPAVWGFVALKKLYYLQKELISKETNNEHT